MKLTFDRNELLQTLKMMHSLLDKSPKLPILKHILVTTTASHITLAATDLELGLQRHMAIPCPESCSFVVPADPVLEFIRELHAPTVQWTVDSTHNMTISAGKTKAKFTGLDAQDYPALPAIPAPLLFSLPIGDLQDLLNETLPAVGEQTERYILNAIRFQMIDGAIPILQAVGTDGKRLVLTSRATGTWLTKDHETKTMLVPKKIGKVLKTLLANVDDTHIGIGLSANLAGFQLGATMLTSRLMEGQYPKHEGVIPQKTNALFTLPKLNLEDPLRRVSVISGRDAKPIQVKIRPTEILLQAVNVDMGEATESIEITSTRDELVTGFNTHYLLDALASMPGEHCQVYMDSPLAPCLLTTPERPEWNHIVMPLKV